MAFAAACAQVGEIVGHGILSLPGDTEEDGDRRLYFTELHIGEATLAWDKRC